MIRIISGKYKGRIIKMPKGIRPSQDKVRKALFDILFDIKELSFLELFAGSGAVGIEALSGGAKEVVFVEKDPQCLRIINDNLSLLGAGGYCSVIGLDAAEAIERLSQNNTIFDIIFLDPPYCAEGSASSNRHQGSGYIQKGSLAKKTLQILATYDILTPNGLIIVEHFKKDSLPDNLGVFSLCRQSRYGDTALSFYNKKSNK